MFMNGKSIWCKAAVLGLAVGVVFGLISLIAPVFGSLSILGFCIAVIGFLADWVFKLFD